MLTNQHLNMRDGIQDQPQLKKKKTQKEQLGVQVLSVENNEQKRLAVFQLHQPHEISKFYTHNRQLNITSQFQKLNHAQKQHFMANLQMGIGVNHQLSQWLKQSYQHCLKTPFGVQFKKNLKAKVSEDKQKQKTDWGDKLSSIIMSIMALSNEILVYIFFFIAYILLFISFVDNQETQYIKQTQGSTVRQYKIVITYSRSGVQITAFVLSTIAFLISIVIIFKKLCELKQSNEDKSTGQHQNRSQ